MCLLWRRKESYIELLRCIVASSKVRVYWSGVFGTSVQAFRMVSSVLDEYGLKGWAMNSTQTLTLIENTKKIIKIEEVL